MRCLLLLCLSFVSLQTYGNSTVIPVKGLAHQATIKIDQWGVAHIEADSAYDAYYTQGFNIARERLWQIDLWRKRGLGLLSEVFGSAFIEKDRASRLFLYRGSMNSEWRAYGYKAKPIIRAFVNGINQYIALVEARKVELPIEFRLLGYVPQRWNPEDVLRIRVHGISRNVSSEVARARVTRDLGLAADGFRNLLSPPHNVTIPEGMNYTNFPDDVLKVFKKATQAVYFGPASQLEAPPFVSPAAAKSFRNKVMAALTQSAPVVKDSSTFGSNNWVLAPSKTVSKRAILASDPHRLNTVPSGRYIVHLKAPGLNIIGAGEPYIPGVSMGHNEDIAFGFTIFSADQEDLYEYDSKDTTLAEYNYKNKWKKVIEIEETIAVKGLPAEKIVLKYTQHGPVVFEDAVHQKIYAIRAAWLDKGMAPYVGSLGYQNAKTWWAYKRSLKRFANPNENHVYADVKGNIGWQVAGKVPIRKNWDGLLPVKGDGRYEWGGYVSRHKLPGDYNPAEGWLATANQMNLPDNYPIQIGYEWAAPHRYNRIKEVLQSSNQHSIESNLALQTDYLSIPARSVLAVLDPTDFSTPSVSKRIAQLKQWNKKLTPGSVEAAFFEIWWARFMRPLVVLEFIPQQAIDYFADLSGFGDQEIIIGLIQEAMLSSNSRISKQRMIELVTTAIFGTEKKLIAEGLSGKTWGELHQAYFKHPIAPLLPVDVAKLLEAGAPAARGGSIDTVNANWHAANLTGDFRVVAGTSWRMIIDVGGWDSSLVVNMPGQSGRHDSLFYKNLVPLWSNDKAFPLLYSDAAVNKHTVETIVLVPVKK